MKMIMMTRVGIYIFVWLMFWGISGVYEADSGTPILSGEVTAALFWGGLVMFVTVSYFWQKHKKAE